MCVSGISFGVALRALVMRVMSFQMRFRGSPEGKPLVFFWGTRLLLLVLSFAWVQLFPFFGLAQKAFLGQIISHLRWGPILDMSRLLKKTRVDEGEERIPAIHWCGCRSG